MWPGVQEHIFGFIIYYFLHFWSYVRSLFTSTYPQPYLLPYTISHSTHHLINIARSWLLEFMVLVLLWAGTVYKVQHWQEILEKYSITFLLQCTISPKSLHTSMSPVGWTTTCSLIKRLFHKFREYLLGKIFNNFTLVQCIMSPVGCTATRLFVWSFWRWLKLWSNGSVLMHQCFKVSQDI